MKLNFDELRTLKFALEAANSEISNRISAIDPRFFSTTEEIDKSAEENFLEEIKLLQERINKAAMRKLAIEIAKKKHGKDYIVTLDEKTHEYISSESCKHD